MRVSFNQSIDLTLCNRMSGIDVICDCLAMFFFRQWARIERYNSDDTNAAVHQHRTQVRGMMFIWHMTQLVRRQVLR